MKNFAYAAICTLLTFVPLCALAQWGTAEIPDSVGGMGFGETVGEADNEALMSLTRSLGVRVQVNYSDKVRDDNGTVTTDYRKSAEVQNKIRNLSDTGLSISKQPDGLYKAVRWINPKKYVNERLAVADSLYNLAQSPYDKDIIYITVHTSWYPKTYVNKKLNFRLGYLYMAYTIRDDELISLFVPDNEKTKQNIKQLALDWQKGCFIDQIPGFDYNRYYNKKRNECNVDVLGLYLYLRSSSIPAGRMGYDIEYRSNIVNWQNRYSRSRDSKSDTLYNRSIRITFHKDGIERNIYKRKPITCRIPFFYYKGEVETRIDTILHAGCANGRPIVREQKIVIKNAEVCTIDVPDDWRVIIKPKMFSPEILRDYIKDDYEKGRYDDDTYRLCIEKYLGR